MWLEAASSTFLLLGETLLTSFSRCSENEKLEFHLNNPWKRPRQLKNGTVTSVLILQRNLQSMTQTLQNGWGSTKALIQLPSNLSQWMLVMKGFLDQKYSFILRYVVCSPKCVHHWLSHSLIFFYISFSVFKSWFHCTPIWDCGPSYSKLPNWCQKTFVQQYCAVRRFNHVQRFW